MGRTMQFPSLFLAVTPRFYPWKEVPDIRKEMEKRDVGVLFSYFHFTKSRSMKEQLMRQGPHEFFEYDGPIWMDSGAYSAWNSGKQISLRDYMSFITAVAPSLESHDAVVILDAIGDPKATLANLKVMQHEIGDSITIIPVIHFPNTNPLDGVLEDSSIVALGGMVRSFQISQRGSPHAVARWIGSLLSQQPFMHEKHLHGLGLGSPLLQVALQPPLTSLDWLGWRRNAAICEVYTPEGSKMVVDALISRKILAKRPLTEELFERYRPPFFDDMTELALPGNDGFLNRALWNAWWFLKARDHESILCKSRYVRTIQKNLENGLRTK